MMKKMIGLILLGLTFCVSAADSPNNTHTNAVTQVDKTQINKYACHLKQLRNSRYCQMVMFAPAPMR